MTPRRPTDDGTVALDRRVLRLWRLRAGVALTVGALVAVGLAVAGGAGVVAIAVIVTGLVVAGLVVAAWTERVWRSWSFRVGARALHIDHGVLTHHSSTIPFHRVQHIDLEAGPLERRLGLATFVLRTAAASSDATVPGIDAADADRLRLEILALIGNGDAV